MKMILILLVKIPNYDKTVPTYYLNIRCCDIYTKVHFRPSVYER